MTFHMPAPEARAPSTLRMVRHEDGSISMSEEPDGKDD